MITVIQMFGERRNCLVIDDDKLALRLAATVCHELGLKVYVADTPAEAMDELRRRRYEMVVVDHNVHGIAGFEILDQLRSMLRGVHLVVFTADHSDATRAVYCDRGASEFLYKPLSKQAIHFKLKALLERAA
jgi:DNA-binding response OmpR family regulator